MTAPVATDSSKFNIEELLNFPNVCIGNPESLKKKLKCLIEKGDQALHIISDFDMTLSKYWVGEKRNYSSHSVLISTNAVSKEFVESENKLFQEYYPYEISTTISKEEKTIKMVEWWNKCHDFYIREKLSRQKIRDVAKLTSLSYREGINEFIQLTGDKDIPLLVFSAGLGDIIEELLDSKNILQPHMHVISNYMTFSDQPPHHCIGFQDPLIHVLNKGEVALKDTPFYEKITSRPNVILMGDSLGDIHMTGDLEHEILLTVGFLNFDIEALLPVYQKTFDIVITHDGSLDWVNALLNKICQ